MYLATRPPPGQLASDPVWLCHASDAFFHFFPFLMRLDVAGAVCGVYLWLGRAVRIVKLAKLSRSVKLRSMRSMRSLRSMRRLSSMAELGIAWAA